MRAYKALVVELSKIMSIPHAMFLANNAIPLRHGYMEKIAGQIRGLIQRSVRARAEWETVAAMAERTLARLDPDEPEGEGG